MRDPNRRTQLLYLTLAGYAITFTGLVIALIVFINTANPLLSMGSLTLLVVFGLADIALLLPLFIALRRPATYREVHEIGLAGTAKVKTATRTGLRLRLRRKFHRQRMVQYKIVATVNPPTGPSYDATLLEYFDMDSTPTPAQTFHVRIHPDHPDVVAIVHRDRFHIEASKH